MSSSLIHPDLARVLGANNPEHPDGQPPEPSAPAPATTDAVAQLQARLAALEAENKQVKQRYEASSREGIRLHNELQALRSQPPASPRVQSDQSAGLTDPVKALADDGISVDALLHLIDQRVDGRLSPIVDAFAAPGTVAAQYPDYVQHERDVMTHINSDPDLAARFKQKQQALGATEALEWAFLTYSVANKNAPPRVDASGAEQNAQNRIHAELPPTGGSMGNQLSADQQRQADLAAAWKHGDSTGDWTAFLNLRIPNPHPDIPRGNS